MLKVGDKDVIKLAIGDNVFSSITKYDDGTIDVGDDNYVKTKVGYKIQPFMSRIDAFRLTTGGTYYIGTEYTGNNSFTIVGEIYNPENTNKVLYYIIIETSDSNSIVLDSNNDIYAVEDLTGFNFVNGGVIKPLYVSALSLFHDEMEVA